MAFSQGNRVFFRSKMGHFRSFRTTKIRRDFRGVGRKMAHSSTCHDTSRKCLFTGIYSINRASEWLWLETEEAPQNGQNVHGFQVRTPICHIVPVSRAYLYRGVPSQPNFHFQPLQVWHTENTNLSVRNTVPIARSKLRSRSRSESPKLLFEES